MIYSKFSKYFPPPNILFSNLCNIIYKQIKSSFKNIFFFLKTSDTKIQETDSEIIKHYAVSLWINIHWLDYYENVNIFNEVQNSFIKVGISTRSETGSRYVSIIKISFSSNNLHKSSRLQPSYISDFIPGFIHRHKLFNIVRGEGAPPQFYLRLQLLCSILCLSYYWT